jgi:hypothetical protein
MPLRMPTARTIPVRLSPAILARLDEYADAIGVDRSAAIRLCLAYQLRIITTTDPRELFDLDGRAHRNEQREISSPAKAPAKVPRPTYEQVCALRAEGLSEVQIAMHFGCSESTVRRRFLRPAPVAEIPQPAVRTGPSAGGSGAQLPSGAPPSARARERTDAVKGPAARQARKKTA